MTKPYFPYTSTARPHSPETAFEAGRANETRARSIREKCRRHVVGMGHYGSTSDEGAQALGLDNPYASRPRFAELHAAGLIVDSGDRRKGLSGRAQVVWIDADLVPMPASLTEVRHG
jgi:hypothetical protein